MVLDEKAQARAEVLNYVYGFTKTSIVKCAIDLGIPDIVEKHGGAISLNELSSAIGCPPHALYRTMRFLTYHGIFKKTKPLQSKSYDNDDMSVYYAQTPISGLFTRDNLGPFVQLQGTPNGPSGGVTVETLKTGGRPKLVSSGSDDLYDDPTFMTKVFRDAMASHAKLTTSVIIDNYADGFKGIRSLVDVGGSYGMALGMLVGAFPWVRGICFDLPEVVAKASPLDGIEFVGGSMFESIPKADAVILMFVLHNWSDKECIDILKRCKEAVPGDSGKVMIVEAIIDEDGEEADEFSGVRLSLDMTMMTITFKGKERTYKEWSYILNEAGFRRYDVHNIKTIESVIEAYP